MLGIAETVIGVAGKVLDKFVGDKDLKAKLEAELSTQLIALDLAQAQANIEQAKHPSIFVSGARPAIMWVCCFCVGAGSLSLPLFLVGDLLSGILLSVYHPWILKLL